MLNPDLVGCLEGEHASIVNHSEVRSLHAGLRFFFPTVRAGRVTAELKGVEKCTLRTVTAPLTLALLVALVPFVWAKLGCTPRRRHIGWIFRAASQRRAVAYPMYRSRTTS